MRYLKSPTSISNSSNKITQIPSQVANLCENSSLSNHSRKNQTLASQKLKILHLASDSFQGGAESVFRNTIEITNKCDDLIIHTASCDKMIKDSAHHTILDDYQNYNKFIGMIKYIFNIKNYKVLLKTLNQTKPDIIHTQNYLSRLSPSVLFALKKYKRQNPQVRLIYTQHTFGACANSCFYNYSKNEICESCIKSSKLKIAFKNCDRRGRLYSIIKAIRTLFYQGIFLKEQNLFDKIIFVSNFQMQKHIEDGYNKSKLQVITNPIDSSFYNSNIKIENKQNLIVFFGRISAEKNIPLLIEAFRELVDEERFREYKLLIIGNGDKKEECKKLAEKLFNNYKYENKPYEFIAHLSPIQLKEILNKAKISVLPSLWYETFGLSIVESILSGVVPLSSNIGALKETNKLGGLHFKLNSTQDLYVVLKETLDHYHQYFNEIPKWQDITLKETNNATYFDRLIKAYITQNGGGVVIIIDLKIFNHINQIKQVFFIDKVDSKTLHTIIQNAKISVLPSFLYETFGLSIVESILSGVVPLSSNIGALKETSIKLHSKYFGLNKNELKNTIIKTLDSYDREFKNTIEQKSKLKYNNINYCNAILKLYKEN